MFKVNSKSLLIILFLPLCIQAQEFGGNPSGTRWRQINTSAARVIFPAGMDSQANRIHQILTVLDTSTIYTIGSRQRKWNTVLLNQTTNSNAYVRLAPVISEFYMTPNQNNFEEGGIRWDDNLAIHENRHMQQLANFNRGFTKVFSFFLGQEGQLLANGLTIPDYFFEGDAVFQETLVSNQGRGRFPYFFNGYKSLWEGKKHYSWMKLRSGSYKHFTPDHYPLGYQLVAYGYETYGQDFWQKVTGDAVRFKGFFYPFNKAIQRYSGKTYRQFREDAMAFFKARSFSVDRASTGRYEYLTKTTSNNVVDYQFPMCIGTDSILVTKRSYRSLNAFYLIVNGKEKKIRVKNSVLDEYFSYSNGKIVYASFQSDARRANRDYSVLQVVDMKTGKQEQVSHRSKYFSPDLNQDASEILAVEVNPSGTNYLHRLNARTGALIQQVPNPNNYFFTQTKYLRSTTAISVARNARGEMALLQVELATGMTENLTGFTTRVLGYPSVKGDTVYFNATEGYADKIFAINLQTKKISRIMNNNTGIYYPVSNDRGDVVAAAFTADGYRLVKIEPQAQAWEEVDGNSLQPLTDLYTIKALQSKGANILSTIKESPVNATQYKKTFQLFNFHSRRPVVSDPEYGYAVSGGNILSSFSNSITYTYNRNEESHTLGYNLQYGGWFPILSVGVEAGYHRSVFDPAVDSTRLTIFNSAKINAGLSVPLRFTGGRTNKFLSMAAGYNAEQLYLYDSKIGKDIFANEWLRYLNASLSFSNVSRQARQHVNPRWAQSFVAGYRYAFNIRKSRKFVSSSSFYFPGIFTNHSIVLQGAYQKRDSFPDLFSNTFSYSRGYSALSSRRMYKWGANYQLPVWYPDLGFGNIIFFQRVRLNAFYDHTNVHIRLSNGVLTDILNRSTGGELFFDTKLWNALPVTFGFRYSRLLDTDLRNTTAVNKWEFVLFNFIPN